MEKKRATQDEKMYRITLKESQMMRLARAADLVSRIRCGQFCDLQQIMEAAYVNNVGFEITTDNLYDVITDDEWMADETKEYLSRPICQRVRPGDTVEVIHKESSIVTGPCTVEGLTVEVGNKNIRVASGKDSMVITVPFNEETRLFEDDTYLIKERYAAFEKEEREC